MTPLETALSAWIAFHAQLGVEVENFLFPPATEAQIVAVEEEIGFRLPEDLRELYQIANGQWDMFEDRNSPLIDVDGDQRWAPLFGHYDFMPLDRALRQYKVYLDIYTSEKEFNTKYYQANPDQQFEPTIWDVREGDAVDAAGWNPSWFTFAGSEANSYSVDMTPPRGGTPGQVVLHGADEWVLQVPGHSITDLMKQAVTHLSIEDEHRYQFSEQGGGYMANVFFNMDWRAELYAPHQHSEEPAAYTAWMEEQLQAEAQRREQFDVWLQGRNMQEAERRSLIQWFDFELMKNHVSIPPMNVIIEMQMQRIAEGEMPDLSELVDSAASWTSSDAKKTELQSHITFLAGVYLSRHATGSMHDLNFSTEEAVRLVHQYNFESGKWTANELRKIQALEVEIKNIPLDTAGGFSMSSAGTTLTICTSTFDENTYKSTETCHDVDMSGL